METSVTIRTGIRRGSAHTLSCEDALAYKEINDYVIMAVFDGCSTGVRSYFASNLLSSIFKKRLEEDNMKLLFDGAFSNTAIIVNLIDYIYQDLKLVRDQLKLEICELLSTIVISIVDKKNRDGCYCIVGDGNVYLNHELLIRVEPENNAPLYMAYYLHDGHLNDHSFLNDAKIGEFKNVKDLTISTDGIDSFLNKTTKKEVDVSKMLVVDENLIKSKSMITRKCNMIENEKLANATNYDDLAIIRLKLEDITEETKAE